MKVCTCFCDIGFVVKICAYFCGTDINPEKSAGVKIYM